MGKPLATPPPDGTERSLLILWRLSSTALQESGEIRSSVNIRVFLAIRFPNFTQRSPLHSTLYGLFWGFFFLAVLDALLRPLPLLQRTCIRHNEKSI